VDVKLCLSRKNTLLKVPENRVQRRILFWAYKGGGLEGLRKMHYEQFHDFYSSLQACIMMMIWVKRIGKVLGCSIPNKGT
jgi:hypothetical protein